MRVEEIPLDDIDGGDQSFRISEQLDLPGLEMSLREIGQVNPLVLMEAEDGRHSVVCGFRRHRALRRMGSARAAARTLRRNEFDFLGAFRVAIWDNLPHRRLAPLEQSRILHTLRHRCGVQADVLVSVYLPLLGLKAHKNVLRSFLALHDLPEPLREMFHRERITLQTALRLAKAPAELGRRFARLLGRVHWSASLQRQVLDLVEELAVIEGVEPVRVLEYDEIAGILEDPGLSPRRKGDRIHEALYRRRNPRLSLARKRFEEERRKLQVPGDVRLSPDPFFESPRLRVEFEAASPRRFREIAAALHEASDSRALDRLFEVR